MTTAAIDLGGTSLRVGYLGPGGFTLVPSADGTGAVPAAVWLAAAGDVRAGDLAASGPPGEVITTIRPDLLADSRATARERYFHGRFESPVAVAGYLLEDAARRAALAAGSDVTDAILGRPATVDDTALLRRAAAAARLTVAGIIAEPVAVALHYGAVADGVDHVTVVADLGGTTIDVTVLRISGRVVTIAAAARQPACGAAELPAAVTELTRQTIAEAAGGPGGHPDTVLLAGGASQVPSVGDTLAGRLGLHVRMSQPELAVVRGLALSADFGLLFVTGLGGDALSPPPPPPPRATPSPEAASGQAPSAVHPLPRPADPLPRPADPLPRPADPVPASGTADPAAADPLPRLADMEQHGTVLEDPSRPAPAEAAPSRIAAPPPTLPPPPPPPPRRPTGAGGAGRTPPAPGEVPVGGTPDGGQLAGRPVERLRALRRGDHLLLTWDWPDGSAEAQIRWRSDADGPGQHGSARCSRRLYNHEGGFEIPVGRDGVMVTVEALGYGPEFDGSPPSALRVEPALPAVMYDPAVHGWRKWTATVTFTSPVDCELPPVFAVLGTGGYKPESTKDGEVVQVIPAQPLSAGQPAVVTFELAPRRGTCWLVCLPADDDTVPQVDLRPAALHRLKVRG
jgi:Hsp70 protein